MSCHTEQTSHGTDPEVLEYWRDQQECMSAHGGDDSHGNRWHKLALMEAALIYNRSPAAYCDLQVGVCDRVWCAYSDCGSVS